jgi:hypothetical protein
MGKKRGRPPKDPDEKAEERLEIRLLPASKSLWLAAAEKAGLRLSAWIRQRLDKAAKKESRQD